MESGFLKYRVKFLILSLLAIKPSHGYELSKSIEEITLGEVKGGPGTIYPVLHDLVKDGLVAEETVVEKGRAKRIYSLTRRGAELLASQLEAFNAIMTNILSITSEASRALANMISPGEARCPPRELVERLTRLRRVIDTYIEALSESLKNC
ncbi:MAG: PadR family transcriptional regulator [Desulfurococcales archaeon]|nr:PadR family transcriptional regulator [Desulfurococcales archaeon]